MSIPNLPENATLTDDTRTLKAGEVLVWDDRIKPALTPQIIADARAKGAAHIITNASVTGPDIIPVPDPGKMLAAYAAETWPRQPKVMLGVTGTSGKTSVAWFCQALGAACGVNTASLGTLGTVRNNKVESYFGYTSPTALVLHPMLQQLADDGTTHACMEVSSHALALHRADGVRFTAAALTNITQDHFDFHGNYDNYFSAKARLFTEVLQPGSTAVLPIVRPEAWGLASVAKQRGLRVLGVGTGNAELVVEVKEATGQGLSVNLKYSATPVAAQVPLVGAFQAENLAVALGLMLAGGLPWEKLSKAVPTLSAPPGRMELTPATQSSPCVVVDYAHKPDALARVLMSLKPMAEATGGNLIVVFGCGGNRDATKRPLMGKIAADMANVVIITDDNPRNEKPDTIRAEVEKGAKTGLSKFVHNIGDRRKAIAAALDAATPRDIVLIAGKGHEEGQIVGDKTLPFDDRLVVKELLA
jgi:UDP-N-acetylmuramoyl-L-alanyl-D-glutamate--2,6-diaminopimelate ligase